MKNRTAKIINCLAVCIACTVMNGMAQTWNCGANLTATLSSGTLAISGTGAMTNYNATNAPWYSTRASITAVVIGDNVSSVGNYAFNVCSNLETVTIGSSVTSVGNYAFQNCGSLTSVTIHSLVETIGTYAFNACNKLSSIDIPNSVISIGNYAFRSCSSLTSVTIPDLVGTIGTEAFYGCSNLETVIIGASVGSIGNSAFRGCSVLSTVIFNAANCATMGNSLYPVFQDCGELSELNIGSAVTKIPGYAFYRCNGLISVSIPDLVESIGTYAFSGCTDLTSVTIGNSVLSIGSYAFQNCGSLTSVTIPDLVETIGTYAFSGCSDLETVIIGASVASIGNDAFYNCTELTIVNLPNSVTVIGSNVFSGCTKLTYVNIPEQVTSIEAYTFRNCTALTTLQFNAINCTLNNSAFSGCTALATLAIGGYVTAIPVSLPNYYTFSAIHVDDGNTTYSSDNGVLFNKDRTTLIRYPHSKQGDAYLIPGTVKIIDESAFYGCNLTSVTIPGSVTDIMDGAFYDCSNMNEVNIPEGVVNIGVKAFADCGITSVAIPGTVANIGFFAFGFDLTAYHVSGENMNYSSLDGVLYNKERTHLLAYPQKKEGTSFDIPAGVTHIGDEAFFSCSNLISVIIPNSVTGIGSYAFSKCTGLTSMIIPNSVTDIGGGVFEICTDLTSIIISNSMTNIGYGFFQGCSSLTFVDIPNGVTGIDESAFRNCSSLVSVVIPGSVTGIGNNAFNGCGNLRDITVSWTIPLTLTATNIFTGVPASSCNLYVPSGTAEAYQNAAIWRNFTVHDSYAIHTVTFNSRGGSAVPAIELKTGQRVPVPVTPVLEGYYHAGWFSDAECTVAWNFTSNVVMDDITLYAKWAGGFTEGSGTSGSPFLIANREDLEKIRDFVGSAFQNVYFLLIADIDLSGNDWIPIGDGSMGFRGNFNGDGYRILNLNIGQNGVTWQYTGLFGFLSGDASITNLHIASGNIRGGGGNSYTGAIAGYANSNVNIAGCTNSSNVTGGSELTEADAASYTGGIVGYAQCVVNYTINISRCTNNGNITAGETPRAFTGGIVGWGEHRGNNTLDINRCLNNGTITGGGTSISRTGGIIGYAYSLATSTTNFDCKVVVRQCVNSGKIIGGSIPESCTGGIAGATLAYGFVPPNTAVMIELSIEDCYNQAVVHATNGYAGGITGYFQRNGTGVDYLARSYSSGKVSGNSLSAGGIAGLNNSMIRYSVAAQTSIDGLTANRIASIGVSITGSYANSDMLVNGVTITSEGANTNDGMDKTMNELYRQETYTAAPMNWNFSTVWDIRSDETSLPYLRFQAAPPVVESVGTTTFKINIYGASDSVRVYRYTTQTGMSYLQTVVQPVNTAKGYLLASPVTANDTLAFVNYDNTGSKWAPSYPALARGATGDDIEITYTLTFDTQGGSAVDPIIVNPGEKATRPANPVLGGYTFGGWFKDEECTDVWDFDTDVLNNDVTLYAKWISSSAPTNTVTFDPQGGSAVTPQTIEDGGHATQPADPTQDGFTFAGWFKDAACTDLWDFANDAVTTNVTLFAKWISNSVRTFTVTFDPQGGTAVQTQTIAQGDKVTQPADPEREGYTFGGWFKEAACINAWNFSIDAVDSDVTIYAKWTENTRTGVETPEAPFARIYPNPTDGAITLSFSAPGVYHITIADMTGKILLRQTVNDQIVQIDFSNFPTGTYLLTIDDKKRQSTTRIVKN